MDELNDDAEKKSLQLQETLNNFVYSSKDNVEFIGRLTYIACLGVNLFQKNLERILGQSQDLPKKLQKKILKEEKVCRDFLKYMIPKDQWEKFSLKDEKK